MSSKLGTFALVFSMAFPVLYVCCDLFGLPLFSYFPSINRIELGWVPPRKGDGPVMYWYGWVASCIIGGTVLGGLATLLPQGATRKIPLCLVWLLPIVAIPILAWSLMPFWTKGG